EAWCDGLKGKPLPPIAHCFGQTLHRLNSPGAMLDELKRSGFDLDRNDRVVYTPKRAADPPQYVTLEKMAAIVNVCKKTMTRRVNDESNSCPAPDKEGGGGKWHKWKWPKIRPWLEQQFERSLPERFPNLSHS